MANPSKRYPWVTELWVEKLQQWFPIEGFRDEISADAALGAARKRDPKLVARVRNILTNPTS